MIDYSWVPWYRDLVQKIARGGRDFLVRGAKAIDWLKDDPPILKFGDENVDPFSFIYTLSYKVRDDAFMRRLRSAHEVFDVGVECPSERPDILMPTPRNTLFHNEGNGRPDLLWKLFRQAAADAPDIDAQLFDAALAIGNVRMAKLTQALSFVNPSYFFPVDNAKRALGRGSGMLLPEPAFDKQPVNHADYEKCVNALKELFPGCKPYEINNFLSEQERNPLVTSESRYFQASTGIDGEQGEDYWPEFEDWNGVWTGSSGGSDAVVTGNDALRALAGAVRTATYTLHGDYTPIPRTGSIIEALYDAIKRAGGSCTGEQAIEAVQAAGWVRPKSGTPMTSTDIATTLRWLVQHERLHVHRRTGATDERPFPLSEPKRGDIVLVRYGVTNGRGIGIVDGNGYSDDGWTEDETISVYWINKRHVALRGQTDRRAFGHADKAAPVTKRSSRRTVTPIRLTPSIVWLPRLAARDRSRCNRPRNGRTSTCL